MDAIEKRARDILDSHVDAYWLEDQGKCVLVEEAVNAIIAALTPPDGYVLVPVEPTDAMKEAGSMWNTEMDEPPEFSALMSIWKDMLAARPEAPNVND